MVVPLHGGVPRQGQLDRLESLDLKNGACLVVATMGRLLDLLQGPKEAEGGGEEKDNKKNECSVSPQLSQLCHSLHTVVLDEADQLASNRDLCAQLSTLFATHMVVTDDSRLAPQMVLCSATWPDKVTPLWRSWLQRFSSSSTTRLNRPCAVLQVNSMASSLPQTMTTSTTVASPTPNNNNMEHSVHESHANTNKDGCHEEAMPTEPEHDMETQFAKDKNDDDNDNNTAKRPKHQWSDIPSNITQKLHVCAEHKKPRKLLTTLAQLGVYGKHAHPTKPKERSISLGLVFFATIKALQQASKLLRKEGIACLELHSKLSQSTRERNIQTFSCGKIPLLLATDVAARGLHVQGIRYVIQYDFPGNLEQYVHRCGRAGRRRSGGPQQQQQQQQQQQSATVYSFFTRNLAPLAHDMVTLLTASHQWVDPNLLALTQTTPKVDKKNQTSKEKDETPTKNRKGMEPDNAPLHDSFQKKKSNNQHDNVQEGGVVEQDHSNDDLQNEEEEEDEYPSLALDRIVLKRASHVSDASSSSLSSEDESSERE